jgi:2-methylisocitrate lyase-like PEP mutase family enzyme
MEIQELARRGAEFRSLHSSTAPLIVANPWDTGSARLLAKAGFKALATTSAGLAFSLGRRDGDGSVSAEETFQHIKQIVNATILPVTADLENGFGASPESVAHAIRKSGELGLAGASIEDATYIQDSPLFDRVLAIERIQAAVEAARSLPYPFMLTARTEGFIRGRPDLEETLKRLQAFEDAGADVLYAPGLPDEKALRVVCSTISKPFNYVAGCGSNQFTVAQLKDFGVRRISLGSSLARLAFNSVMMASQEILNQGKFEFTRNLPSVSQINSWID